MRVESFPRRIRVFAIVVPLTVAVGCLPNTDAYVSLQDTMKSHITKNDHRPVESVSCTPHVTGVTRGGTAHLRCFVVFKDGSSYTANAVIQDQNTANLHNIADSYTWDSPPQK
jgi:hypothetical protein